MFVYKFTIMLTSNLWDLVYNYMYNVYTFSYIAEYCEVGIFVSYCSSLGQLNLSPDNDS